MAETLKDFLVSIGFDFNETSQRRFVDAMRTADIQARALMDSLEALARTVWDSVSKAASAFDQLYFSVQRTGASAATIRDMGYAVGQLGGSAQAAQASLEAMGQKLRENPGNLAYLNALGLQFNRITGHLEDNVELLEKFQRMPMAVAEQFRALAGMDEGTFLARRDPRYLQLVREAAQARKLLGFDPDQAAKDANAFMTTWRGVANELGVIADDLLTKLMKALDEPLREFKKFLEANAPAIKESIETVTKAVGEMAKAWVEQFEKTINNPDELQRFHKAMQAIADSIAAMARAMGDFAGYVSSIKWFFDRLGEIAPGPGMLWNGLRPMSPWLGGPTDPKGNPVPFSGDAPATPEGKPQSWWEWGKRKAGGLWNGVTGALGFGGASAATVPASPDGAGGAAAPGARGPAYSQENARALIAAAAELGTTPEDLATVIAYETMGTFSTSIMGGKPAPGFPKGAYMGLIQFGPAERAQFGVSADQTFAEQMRSVVAYLKARGFKPGMGLLDLYSTINAGSPGHYDRSDGNGTVAGHVQRMQRERGAQARAFIGMATGGGMPGFRKSKGEWVNGNWVPPGANADPRIWKPNGGGVVDSQDLPPEYRGGRPDPRGFGAVQRDAAEGDAQIKKWEQKPKSPWGSLNNYWSSSAPLGFSGGDSTHVTINAKNEFNIDGANDPSIVAHMVAANQDRINGDLTRNMIGATN